MVLYAGSTGNGPPGRSAGLDQSEARTPSARRSQMITSDSAGTAGCKQVYHSFGRVERPFAMRLVPLAPQKVVSRIQGSTLLACGSWPVGGGAPKRFADRSQ